MTTQKQWDDFHATEHSPDEVESFNNHAMANYQEPFDWRMIGGLVFLIALVLLCILIVLFYQWALNVALHIPPVSTPDMAR